MKNFIIKLLEKIEAKINDKEEYFHKDYRVSYGNCIIGGKPHFCDDCSYNRNSEINL